MEDQNVSTSKIDVASATQDTFKEVAMDDAPQPLTKPLYRSTLHLLKTYTHINEVFFAHFLT
jgi:hypothetical protein